MKKRKTAEIKEERGPIEGTRKYYSVSYTHNTSQQQRLAQNPADLLLGSVFLCAVLSDEIVSSFHRQQ